MYDLDGGGGGEDEDKGGDGWRTLQELKLEIGDYMDVAVMSRAPQQSTTAGGAADTPG